MKFNSEQISAWFKNHLDEIILTIGVILISLLSFAIGYITAKQEEKKPIKIEYENSNYWSRHHRSFFEPETFGKRA